MFFNGIGSEKFYANHSFKILFPESHTGMPGFSAGVSF
jgi:hypothetical protein